MTLVRVILEYVSFVDDPLFAKLHCLFNAGIAAGLECMTVNGIRTVPQVNPRVNSQLYFYEEIINF